jgi:sigma-54 dependent transcriptional regulator, acetoin dehydrogenase operon transcriptional activator AcoR
VFGPESDVVAVINASALTAPEDRRSQSIVFHLVAQHARLIENAFFLESNRHRWNLQLSRAGHGFEPEYLLALDDAGHIVQANVRARLDLLDRAGPLPVPLHAVFQASTEELMRTAFERPGRPVALRELSSGNCFSCIVRCPEVRPAARRKPDGGQGFAALVTEDARVAGDIQRIKRIVDSRLPILLLGETGVGKEAFARAIHLQSARRDRPFVALNCAAIPENLIESELFGYREGAFTGAKQKGETGKIQLSSGGTLFLDEIGDMPLTLQTRLLRVLAEGEVLPLGGGEPEKVDLNVICATHRDVQQLVAQNRFREDLFYRLNAATFRLPALRERSDKREVLQQVFEAECVAAGRSLGLNTDLIELLLTYDWPGNIRQLRNSLRYAIAVCEADELALAHMPEQIVQALVDAPAGTANLALSSQQADERERMLDALRTVQWRVTDAALSLGIPRATFYRKMHRYGLLRAHRADEPQT